ncbi:hypothetical protein KKA13_04105 [Patescibacteria group bacterium]|nr:hypothetical protein [Patescibacteria group bacterium]MBU1612898.1 hypothetical protein [Patescibacteria group bacterium]
MASLVEWFLYTLWVRTIARAKDTIIIPVTFINATATIVAPWLYDMMKTYNPDGISYKLIGIIVYGLGGVVGAMLALRLRQNK